MVFLPGLVVTVAALLLGAVPPFYTALGKGMDVSL